MTPPYSSMAIDRVAAYLQNDITITPDEHRGKRALRNGWQKERLTLPELAPYYASDQPCNIGAVLGEPSGDRVDADLDADETLPIADWFLPRTGALFGRKSKPRSHRFYTAHLKTVKYRDPVSADDDGDDRAMLLEIRSTGSQTVLPGSTHASGEAIEWENGDGVTVPEATAVEPETLLKRAGMLAATALFGRYYPGPGTRHDFDLAVSGALLGSGLDCADVVLMVQGAAVAAGLPEEPRRAQAVADTVRKIADHEEVTGWPTVAELLGPHGAAIVKAVKKWLGLKSVGRGQSQASALREIGEQQSESLFHDAQGQPYAAINRGDHCETYRIGSVAFREVLVDSYMRANDGAVPGKQAIEEAIHALKALATIRGPEQAVYLRVGEHNGDIWLDLGGLDWRGIRITASGWGVETLPAGMFRRSKGMGQLPEPVPGSVAQLRPYVNAGEGTEGDARFMLMVAWLLGALRPKGPYTILALTSAQGRGKSSTARFLRSTIDPHTSLLLSPPTNGADAWVKAAHNAVLAFDNMSYISPELSDCFCRMATGGGYGKRLLYSDDELHLAEGMWPQLFTGIGDIVSRSDLTDRSLLLHQPQLTTYRAENDLWAGFARDHPGILGALCDGVSAALANLPSTTLASPPRMADFALWIEAASPGLGWEPGAFLDLYNANRDEASAIALEGSPIGQAVLGFMEGKAKWEGTASELLTALESDLDSWKDMKARGWPRTPKALSDGLERISTNLLAVGIAYERRRTKHDRITALKRVTQGDAG